MNSISGAVPITKNPTPFGPVPAANKPGNKGSYRVKVVNSIWNGAGTIRRKKAEYYVSLQRAEWVGPDQVRMLMAHPENRAAAAKAAFGYEAIIRTMTVKELANLPIVRQDIAYTHRSVAAARRVGGREDSVHVVTRSR